MKIIWTPKAVKSLDEIFNYILYENPKSAYKVRNRLVEKTSLLEVSPFAGTQYDLNTRKLSLGDFPYSIYYRVKNVEIQILQVRHERRMAPKSS